MSEVFIKRAKSLFKDFTGKSINLFGVIFFIASSGLSVYGLDSRQETEIAFARSISESQDYFSTSDCSNDIVKMDTIPWKWFRRIFNPKRKKGNKRVNKSGSKEETKDPQALFPDNHGYLNDMTCEVTFEGFDPTLQKSKKELSYQHLFSHTHPEIKHYIPGQELLKAEGRLTRMDGGYLYLTLKFIWSADNPQKFYGNFKNKNPVHFELAQDKQITLYNSASADWQVDTDGNNYVLTALYSIHPKQAQLFRRYFVMNMRVYWERGYQDYPVYNIGMIKDQLDCL